MSNNKKRKTKNKKNMVNSSPDPVWRISEQGIFGINSLPKKHISLNCANNYDETNKL